ncbi:ABC transporter permease [Streptomyces sp. NPDC004230]
MAFVRTAFISGLLAYRALFNRLAPPMFVCSLMAAPVFQLLFFVYVGRQVRRGADAFYVIGNVFLAGTAACVIGGTMAIANERRFGTLGAVLLSPRSRALVWGSRALPYVVNALLVMVFTLCCGVLLIGVSIPGSALAPLALCLLAAGLSGTAFGFVIGAVGLRARNTMIIANVAITLLILLSGSIVPRDVLPLWLGSLGAILPLTHVTQAARMLISSSAEPSAVTAALSRELIVAVGHALLAALLLRYFERASRRNAALDTV